jgi:hypothetical protein
MIAAVGQDKHWQVRITTFDKHLLEKLFGIRCTVIGEAHQLCYDGACLVMQHSLIILMVVNKAFCGFPHKSVLVLNPTYPCHVLLCVLQLPTLRPRQLEMLQHSVRHWHRLAPAMQRHV